MSGKNKLVEYSDLASSFTLIDNYMLSAKGNATTRRKHDCWYHLYICTYK